MTNKIGDQPIDPQYQRMMNTLASVLDESFNGDKKGKDRTVGFILMVFPFGDDNDGRCNYISNARRSDVVKLLKEQIKRFAKQDNPQE
jgi:hypothetical protein